MCCFLSGDWLRSIVRPRKSKKKARSKEAKVHSDIENAANGTDIIDAIETSDIAASESTSVVNGGARRFRGVTGVSAQHLAATRIQTAFRVYMAKKAIHRQKGAVRFNVLMQGHDTQKQSMSTLNYIHSWSYIQEQINARRYHMVTEGRIKQKKLENQLKLEAKLHELEVEWSGSSETMEEILSKIQQREEAAVKRERAMAYAFSHQWRANPTQYLGQAYYSLGKENWGWSWQERWIAARPWEVRATSQPLVTRKCHVRQGSKSEIVKTPLSITKSASSLSNGKGGGSGGGSSGGTNNKAKKLSHNPATTADDQDATTALSCHASV